MTLQASILTTIPVTGCTVKWLRSRLKGYPYLIDHALIGMQSSGDIRIVLGTVTKRVTAAMVPCEPVPEITPLPSRPLTPEERVQRASQRSKAWRVAHPERNRQHQRDFRKRQRVVDRGGYAGQRIQQIEGGS